MIDTYSAWEAHTNGTHRNEMAGTADPGMGIERMGFP
jgi:hypothetical protein